MRPRTASELETELQGKENMAQKISSYLTVDPKIFDKKGIFDTVIGIDTHLFLDPFLLRKTQIPEFIMVILLDFCRPQGKLTI